MFKIVKTENEKLEPGFSIMKKRYFLWIIPIWSPHINAKGKTTFYKSEKFANNICKQLNSKK